MQRGGQLTEEQIADEMRIKDVGKKGSLVLNEEKERVLHSYDLSILSVRSRKDEHLEGTCRGGGRQRGERIARSRSRSKSTERNRQRKRRNRSSSREGSDKQQPTAAFHAAKAPPGMKRASSVLSPALPVCAPAHGDRTDSLTSKCSNSNGTILAIHPEVTQRSVSSAAPLLAPNSRQPFQTTLSALLDAARDDDTEDLDEDNGDSKVLLPAPDKATLAAFFPELFPKILYDLQVRLNGRACLS